MGFHASEHGFHGLVYFLCPFLGGDAVARKKWQQKVKKERGKMKTKVIHAFLWILVCMVLGITCYQCRDLRGYVILSGSMEPVIPTGSVAVVDSSKRDVRPGNIATFERHGDLVTHRILSKTEEGYQTKGDANTDPDSGTIPAENIRGTYLFCIPYLGYGFMWAKNHMFLTVGFLALFMLLVFYFPEKRPEPKEREQVKKTKRKKGELRLLQRKK
ncbi:MAG: signal peptidase I [Lachnospiraceae bacterium]|nr:signal peptidase I [Lachnospiraceae bacterium]